MDNDTLCAEVVSKEELIEDCFERIRNSYGVPAKMGMKVVADGEPGVIVGVTLHSCYLLIKIDGTEQERPYHPNWHIKYLPEGK